MNRCQRRGALLVPAVLTLAAMLFASAPAAAQQPLETAVGFVFPLKSATVVSSFDYQVVTYMAIEAGAGSRVWVVAPVCGVKAGDSISVPEGKYYPQVLSTGLGMTFENLIVPTVLELNGQSIKAFAAHGLPEGCQVRRGD